MAGLRSLLWLCALVLFWSTHFGQSGPRLVIPLSGEWLTFLSKNSANAAGQRTQHESAGNQETGAPPMPQHDAPWKTVLIPHNWDQYEGYRRLLHGNFHGDAWYRKEFSILQEKKNKRFFLFFEGVGSYAAVFVNGQLAGAHAGGRTTFTLDITSLIKTDGSRNQLLVHASHPASIQDLPWVCGGCSEERGFSEGSQPLGIFRPVQLMVTNDVRIEPFGIHAWADIQSGSAQLMINTSLKNYSRQTRQVTIIHQLVDVNKKIISETTAPQTLQPGDSVTVLQKNITVSNPQLWSTANPYLYTIVSFIKEKAQIIDSTSTQFGFRTIQWKNSGHQFLLNGQPVFINGVGEYEHLMGQSHAFSPQQIKSRMNWVRAAGFKAFRDAHQPHNLLYGKLCNQFGILWWTQFSAHIWYDSPAFRQHFKQLLKEWVIERRNDPSVILWGLQNESKLPEDFAKECTGLIRQLDPTASSQRLVTTCNGGSGTDWDVPQNWTGTYGGDPNTYDEDVKKQVLIGEYGAWRTLDLHTEGGFVQNGITSEDRMTQLMEQKIRLAESVKDSSAGQFFWILTSHENPGRVQGGEGWRALDRVGPINYKGLLTPWEEPLDAFYMFRSNFAPKDKEPMVYIVSHTWPNRWLTPGIKDSIYVYSNCDEVELFNDIDHASLGKRKRAGIGTHFQWDNVPVKYNILYAVGFVNGKAVARDTIVLHHLPAAPHFQQLFTQHSSITQPQAGYHYVYRVNCGGPEYTDVHGNVWLADCALPVDSDGKEQHKKYRGAVNWTNDFPGMPASFASQRRTFSPVKGTSDWPLFQTFRYGKDKLHYEFPLPDGEYLVEFYAIEPWIGIGGGFQQYGTGMRLFDIAINGKIVLQDIDLWSAAGTNSAWKKTVKTTITGGRMIISFPQSKAGQALLSAIAIASLKKNITPSPAHTLITQLSDKQARPSTWLDIGQRTFTDASISFHSLPPELFGAGWLQMSKQAQTNNVSFVITAAADVFVSIRQGTPVPDLLKNFEHTKTNITTDENGGTNYAVYKKRFAKNSSLLVPSGRDALIIVQPATHMEPAFDLKPVSSYRANIAVTGEGTQKETREGREVVVVKTNQPVQVEWPIQTGVADIYSITLKYFYPEKENLPGKLQLTGAGKTMMPDAPIYFTFTRSGKWNQFRITTGNMINAGNYTVRLTVEHAEGLVIAGIDVQ